MPSRTQCINAMILSYQMTARPNMIMLSQMGIWNTFITAARQREVQHLCTLDAHYVVRVKTIRAKKRWDILI